MNGRSRHPRVRPRWVWAGTGCTIAGASLAGIGVAHRSWTWSGAGGLLVVLGAVAALAGGILYDVHSGSPREELRQVLRGGVHRGVRPGETRSTRASRNRSRRLEQRRRAPERAAIEAPRPSLLGPAAIILLLVALFLLVAQWELYPRELPGQTNANRALACAIVVALAGLRVLTAQPGRAHRLSGGLAAAAGLALLLNALVSPHDRGITQATDLLSGALVMLAGAVVLSYQPPPVWRRPATAWGRAGAPQGRARPVGTTYPGAPDAPVSMGTTSNGSTGVTAVTPAGAASVTGVKPLACDEGQHPGSAQQHP